MLGSGTAEPLPPPPMGGVVPSQLLEISAMSRPLTTPSPFASPLPRCCALLCSQLLETAAMSSPLTTPSKFTSPFARFAITWNVVVKFTSRPKAVP